MTRPTLDGQSTEIVELIAKELDLASLCALRSTNRQLLAQTIYGLKLRCCFWRSSACVTLTDPSLGRLEAVASNPVLRDTIVDLTVREECVDWRKQTDQYPPWILDESGMIDCSKMPGVARLKAILGPGKLDNLRSLWILPERIRPGRSPKASSRFALEICEAIDGTHFAQHVGPERILVAIRSDRHPEEPIWFDYRLAADIEFYWGRKIIYNVDGPVHLTIHSDVKSDAAGLVNQLVDPGDCTAKLESLNLESMCLAMTVRSLLAQSNESLTSVSFDCVHLYHSTWRVLLTEIVDRHPALTTFSLSLLTQEAEHKSFGNNHDAFERVHMYVEGREPRLPACVEFQDITKDVVRKIAGGSVQVQLHERLNGAVHSVWCRGVGTPTVLRHVITNIRLAFCSENWE